MKSTTAAGFHVRKGPSIATAFLVAGLLGLTAAAGKTELTVEWDRELAFERDRQAYQQSLQALLEQGLVRVEALTRMQPATLKVRVYARQAYQDRFGADAAARRGAHYHRGAIHINGGARLNDRFAGLLVHELTHAALDSRGTSHRLPTWLNEGLAEFAGWRRKGLVGLAPNQIVELQRDRDEGRLTPLPTRGKLSPAGYLHCYAAVLYLQDRHGFTAPVALAHSILGGKTPAEALGQQLRMRQERLEADFAAWVAELDPAEPHSGQK